MSLARRLALLRWARENEALIIEDDYDSEFRYSGSPIPALQGLDEYARVLYVGTFSKVMFPGLRLGYVVLPLPLVDVFRRAKWLCDRQCSLIDQAALAEFIDAGHLAGHVRRMRNIYDRRRQVLMDSLLQAAPGTTVPGDAAGLHILACLPDKDDSSAGLGEAALEETYDFQTRSLIRQAEALGVGLFSAGPHYWPVEKALANGSGELGSGELGRDALSRGRPRGRQRGMRSTARELILGFGNIAKDDIEAAIARIRPLL